MFLEKLTVGIDMKALLSTLWIFVLLNMIFRDIHEITTAEFLQEAITGVVNGTRVTEELLLIGGFMIEIPIVMVLLSRILNYRVNRWANVLVGVVMFASVLYFNTAPDMDDIFFAIIEMLALVSIVGIAWRWSSPEFVSNQSRQLVGESQ